MKQLILIIGTISAVYFSPCAGIGWNALIAIGAWELLDNLLDF